MIIIIMKSWGCFHRFPPNLVKWCQMYCNIKLEPIRNSPNFRSTSLAPPLDILPVEFGTAAYTLDPSAVKYAHWTWNRHRKYEASGLKPSKYLQRYPKLAVQKKQRVFQSSNHSPSLTIINQHFSEALFFGLNPSPMARCPWISWIIQGADAFSRQHLTWLHFGRSVRKEEGKVMCPGTSLFYLFKGNPMI